MERVVTYVRSQRDRAAAWAAIAIGALALLLGWLGVSRYTLTASQLPYVVSGGLGGMFLLGVGATLLLSADLQDEWRKLDAIDEKLAELVEEARHRPAAGEVTAPAEVAPTTNGATTPARRRRTAPAMK